VRAVGVLVDDACPSEEGPPPLCFLTLGNFFCLMSSAAKLVDEYLLLSMKTAEELRLLRDSFRGECERIGGVREPRDRFGGGVRLRGR
jgi:hypothetical protein